MKQRWEMLAARIDALSLRERGMVFAAAAAVLAFLAYALWLEPMAGRENTLRLQMQQQQRQIAEIEAEITQKLQLNAVDPDADTRQRLTRSRSELQQSMDALRALQNGLVAPEQMVSVVEDLLRGNGKLRLLSLKTLPVSGLSDSVDKMLAEGKPAAAAPPSAAAMAVPLTAAPASASGAVASGRNPAQPAVKPDELLYRHGVEVTVQGSYLDMVAYMAALEALPTQLFWGKVALDAQQYPNARLTLTLYTLSLDLKWMKL
jgi:MSHA biogenesis protein MshJ